MNKINDLLIEFNNLNLLKGDKNFEISYIQSDSRKLKTSDIFCLYSYFTVEEKRKFIQNSIENNCKIILVNKNDINLIPDDFPNVLEIDFQPELIHGKIASFLKESPSKSLKIIAVTGTNGKTSLTNIIYQFLEFYGLKVGLIGTINIKFGNKTLSSDYTTPDPSGLNEILFSMKEEGIEYVCMEASSHGLKLGRMEGIQIYQAIFTNLTPDHLDFHTDMKDYLQSKFRLFSLLEESKIPGKVGILSKDSEGGKDMINLIHQNSISSTIVKFGENDDYSGKLKSLSLSETSFEFIDKNKEKHLLNTNLLGDFNFINLSLALVSILEIFPHIKMDYWKQKISNLSPIPGRFEIVNGKDKDKIAIVDYAHTPDALENILKSISEIPRNKLITLFGCGGDRDRKKRPLMAEIASRYSDFVIVTSDNPRTEDPDKIIDEITIGITKDEKNWIRIVDRKEAIKKGIDMLPKGGILLVAGKGHEDYQILGTKKIYFSDQAEIKSAFQEIN
ncbi:MAG: UDP-N-acetylmuramoyl-L-alanyl-D-glutamate--2,6-diaminopimelate ligase [Leptospiraceae bacterium]|nr:UDP-N-acetylmuramoyl-L-alanyl-D-glutamate--2,6-diaminopimelate ligase [Leptospiraceae bacterium]